MTICLYTKISSHSSYNEGVMKLTPYLLFGFIATALLSWSCSDEGVALSPVPELTFVSISPDTVEAFSEVVTVTVSYLDGDGDLGENDSEVKNLFVTDNRNQVTFEFRVPQLAPDNANVAITGELPIEINTVGIIDDEADFESVTFSIWTVDRAGNESNMVESAPIFVRR